MALRTITGACYHDDGAPWVDGTVDFYLTRPFETATEFFPKEHHNITLDGAGAFVITLAVPDTGTAPYEIHTPDGLGYAVNIADGPATDLVTLITIASSAIVPSAVQVLLDAASVMTIRPVAVSGPIGASDEYLRASGAITLTLPAATGSGVMFNVKNVGVDTVTLAAQGGETVDGAATQPILPLGWVVVVDAASGAWDIV